MTPPARALCGWCGGLALRVEERHGDDLRTDAVTDGLDRHLDLDTGAGGGVLALDLRQGDVLLERRRPRGRRRLPRLSRAGVDRHGDTRGSRGHRRGEAVPLVDRLDLVPVDVDADDLAGVASSVLLDQSLLPDEPGLVEAHEAAEAHLVRRVRLRVDHGLLAAAEVDVDQEEPRLDPRDVERQHPGGFQIERLAGGDERVPDLDGVAPGRPDLVTEIAGVAGARDVHLDAGDRAARDAEVPQLVDIGLRHLPQELRRRRALEREGADLLRDVLDRDVETRRVLGQPPQVRLRRGPAVEIRPEPAHRAVVDDLPALVAPRSVDDLPD